MFRHSANWLCPRVHALRRETTSSVSDQIPALKPSLQPHSKLHRSGSPLSAPSISAVLENGCNANSTARILYDNLVPNCKQALADTRIPIASYVSEASRSVLASHPSRRISLPLSRIPMSFQIAKEHEGTIGSLSREQMSESYIKNSSGITLTAASSWPNRNEARATGPGEISSAELGPTLLAPSELKRIESRPLTGSDQLNRRSFQVQV
ncbi:unnamed protein product [Protopolystoma xenopodis]|uniref:Uncharacterized protein n=1 Tax=Protopolystoma xenopodis TaxID=117903 RepID=A0A3S5BXC4_9PLAT|nr:unnamed protein product [Protopolystoma xenopodis]